MFRIEGVPVERTIVPASIPETAESVRQLAERSTPLFPVGGRTALDFGLVPSRPGVAIDTTALGRVEDYPSEDMTITVEAGIRMGELARILAERNQMLPIDVPDADQATLGGVLATNTSGSRRLGYGTARDYVLGIDVIDAGGRRVHGGGRVVKNVAGYDLMKLHTGALGTLGVIVQATLKVRPLPGARGALVCPLRTEQIETAWQRTRASDTRPVAIDLVNRAAAADVSDGQALLGECERGDWNLVLLFEESEPAVVWQVERVRRELAEAGLESLVPSRPYDSLLARLIDWPGRRSGLLTFKANLLPDRTCGFCIRAERELPGVRLLAHAGSGIVLGSVAGGDLAGLGPVLAALRKFANDAAGNLVVTHCPTEWKQTLPVWGTPRADWSLMTKIKRQLDPDDLLNPGRFITGPQALEEPIGPKSPGGPG